MNKKWKLKPLPVDIDLESKTILKALPSAHAALAELKGIATTIPNQDIIINTLSIQEAKDSSEIENIITTHDELYKNELNFKAIKFNSSTEVSNYAQALKLGFKKVKKYNLLTNKTILEIQKTIENNNAGFRKLPGTALKNAATGEVIYTPPQHPDKINSLMTNLEKYINDNSLNDIDPIIKLAIIHFQFESIHPFYDGNGRTGRIMNILYLILNDLLDSPILYLSNFINKNKSDYYNYLQDVRTTHDWENWILYIIQGIKETSIETIRLIKEIKKLMQEMKFLIRDNYKFYSQDLLNNLFKHPYTKIEFLVEDLGVSRITAANYLNKLAKDEILKKQKIGTGNFYINYKLFNLLAKR